jgi:hypothetical protein
MQQGPAQQSDKMHAWHQQAMKQARRYVQDKNMQ